MVQRVRALHHSTALGRISQTERRGRTRDLGGRGHMSSQRQRWKQKWGRCQSISIKSCIRSSTHVQLHPEPHKQEAASVSTAAALFRASLITFYSLKSVCTMKPPQCQSEAMLGELAKHWQRQQPKADVWSEQPIIPNMNGLFSLD